MPTDHHPAAAPEVMNLRKMGGPLMTVVPLALEEILPRALRQDGLNFLPKITLI